MDILDSSLGREIEAITGAGATATNFYWEAKIHVNKKDIVPLKLLSVDVQQDFETSFSDETIVQVLVGGGLYAYQLYPYLEDIEITLTKTPLNETDATRDESQKVQAERYVAVMIEPFDPRIAVNASVLPSEFDLDISNVFKIAFQLINKIVDQTRMKTFGTTFRKAKVEDVIKTVLTRETKQVEIDADLAPVGVDMVPASNKAERDHILIPQSTRLVDFAKYVHQNCGGVYGAGMAAYFQKDKWFVFPPYDTTRFEVATKTMTIVNVPAKRMPNIERTYRINGNNLVILATGQASTKNLSEELIANQGNGVRFGTAGAFMEDFVKVENNRALASRGASNTEAMNISRASGFNNVQQSSARITANPFLQYSAMAARDGSLVSLVWENSDPSLIFPGMCIKMLFLEGEEVRTVEGVLIGAHHFTSLVGQGPSSTRHRCQSALKLFVKRVIRFDE